MRYLYEPITFSMERGAAGTDSPEAARSIFRTDVQDGDQEMNYVYMVECVDGTLYTGWTNRLEKRLKAHNQGKDGAKYTKVRRPVKLVYYEGFGTREEAMSRERQIKRLSREEKLKLMKW